MKKIFGLICMAPLAMLVGCGFSNTAAPDLKVDASVIQGTVFGGQQPVKNSDLFVIPIGATGYGSAATALAETHTDDNGNFSFGSYTCPQSNTPVYILSLGGDPGGGTNDEMVLAASIGQCGNAANVVVNVNEVTTIATAYAMAQFYSPTNRAFGGPGSTSGGVTTYSVGLTNAALYTVPTLVQLNLGIPNIRVSGVTVPADKMYSLANVLASCVNSQGTTGADDTTSACGKLFTNTTPPGTGTRKPVSTLEAAVNMALYPYRNVSTLFGLQNGQPPFTGLADAPTDLTLPVAYTVADSSNWSNEYAPDYVPRIAIDGYGQVFFPVNDPNLMAFGEVHPSSGMASVSNVENGCDGFPVSHIVFDANNKMWATCSPSSTVWDFDATASHNVMSYVYPEIDGNFIIPYDLVFDSTNTPNLIINNAYEGHQIELISIPNISYNGTNTTQGATLRSVLPAAAYFLAANSFGEVIGTTSGTPAFWEDVSSAGAERNITLNNWTGSVPGGYAEINNGATIGVNTSSNIECDYADNCTASSGLNSPTGIVVDGNNTAWIANAGNHSVSNYTFSSGAFVALGNYVYSAAIAPQPTDIAIDQSGNVWFNSQGNSASSTVTEIVGAAGPTIQPMASQIAGGVNLSGTKPTR